MELDWRAIPADDERRRTFAEVDLPTEDWEPIAVPGHWRSNPAFAHSDGPLLYRTVFEHHRPTAGQRFWLRFAGIFYQSDAFLDGAYLGNTEGYFFAHTFEVTEALAARTEHSLAVEVTCDPLADRTAKENLTGVFQHWDCFPADVNPGGIWAPVTVERSGPVRITRLRTLCVEANEERAVLTLEAGLDAAETTDVHLRTTVGDVDLGEDHQLAAGENLVEWRVVIDRPRLWWPLALGDPHLEEVTVEVRLADAAGSQVSDRRRFRTGLRQVALDRWKATVNGERLFLKGSNQGPTRMALAEATAAECRRDVELAVEAGLDLLRLHAHVARPETYSAADEAGLLLWQDMPLQWGYSRRVRKQAVRQAQEAVDLLGHHPSVAIWCAHNEPMAIDFDPDTFARPTKFARVGAKFLGSQQLPTWNKTVLDRRIKRALQKADGTRPVVPHSGVLPHLPKLDGTDSHLYFGWYWGDERDFAGFARAVPRMVRFVTEFGAQAVPETADFCEPQRWPHLDWDHIETQHVLQRSNLERRVPVDEHETFDSWRAATQRYQAEVVRHHVETLRRLKYRPTGGFAHFSFADGWPGITWSVLDHERRPKLAYDVLRAACRPVIAVADRPPAKVGPGEAMTLDVHVVSDLREPVEGEVLVLLRSAAGERRWRFAGAVGPDAVARVGTLELRAPEEPGEATLELAGVVGGHDVARSYRFRVAHH